MRIYNQVYRFLCTCQPNVSQTVPIDCTIILCQPQVCVFLPENYSLPVEICPDCLHFHLYFIFLIIFKFLCVDRQTPFPLYCPKKCAKFNEKPSILNEYPLKVHVNVEHEIVNKEMHNFARAKHKLSQGNSFSQITHYGNVLSNSVKVQSIGIQLLDLQHHRNFFT